MGKKLTHTEEVDRINEEMQKHPQYKKGMCVICTSTGITSDPDYKEPDINGVIADACTSLKDKGYDLSIY